MSSAAHISLAELQRWMQSVVTHPGGVLEGAKAAAALLDQSPDEAIAQLVTGSPALNSRQRLEIYQRAYFARLLECLRQDYSVLAKAIGDELFDAFALGFLQEHPPASYTLARLGAGFPEYLAATCPVSTDRESSESSWPRFLIDLAWLEQTVNEVFDGPGAERRPLLSHERLHAIPAECWPAARLICTPSLKLLHLNHSVNACFNAINRGDAYEIPIAEASFVAVVRRNYHVSRYDLTAPQFRLLRALADGVPVGGAIATACDDSAAEVDHDAAKLRRWFHDWTVAGFFLDVRLD